MAEVRVLQVVNPETLLNRGMNFSDFLQSLGIRSVFGFLRVLGVQFFASFALMLFSMNR
jgi:hypothetical protein